MTDIATRTQMLTTCSEKNSTCEGQGFGKIRQGFAGLKLRLWFTIDAIIKRPDFDSRQRSKSLLFSLNAWRVVYFTMLLRLSSVVLL